MGDEESDGGCKKGGKGGEKRVGDKKSQRGKEGVRRGG